MNLSVSKALVPRAEVLYFLERDQARLSATIHLLSDLLQLSAGIRLPYYRLLGTARTVNPPATVWP